MQAWLNKLIEMQNKFAPQTYLAPYSPTEQGPLPMWQQQHTVPSDPVMQMLQHPTGMGGNMDIEQVRAKLREYQSNQPSY
jgi:hypothetical protein